MHFEKNVENILEIILYSAFGERLNWTNIFIISLYSIYYEKHGYSMLYWFQANWKYNLISVVDLNHFQRSSSIWLIKSCHIPIILLLSLSNDSDQDFISNATLIRNISIQNKQQQCLQCTFKKWGLNCAFTCMHVVCNIRLNAIVLIIRMFNYFSRDKEHERIQLRWWYLLLHITTLLFLMKE